MRILLVEDNASIANAIRAMLERRNFAVNVVTDGESGLDHLLQMSHDAAVVDVVLPKSDGFSVVREARAQGVGIPILMLTARDAVEDRILGLRSGADDYLIKPFAEGELVARLQALLRRSGDGRVPSVLVAGKLEVDEAARSAAYAGRALTLGSTEFRLLELFARNVGIVFSRQQLLERIWDYDFEGSSNIVDVYVSALRRKMKLAGGDRIIETVWGVGYRMRT